MGQDGREAIKYSPAEMTEKLETLKLAPDTMKKICIHVANGGSPIDLCELWGVQYGALVEWINQDMSEGGRYQRFQGALQAQSQWTIDRILKELHALATVDISKAYNEDGTLKHPKEMPPELRSAVASIEVFEEFEGVGKDRALVGHTKKVKFWDKPKAIELIGKKFGAWIDRAKIDLRDKSLEDLIAESWKGGAIEVKPEQSTPTPQPTNEPTTPAESTETPHPPVAGDPPPGD